MFKLNGTESKDLLAQPETGMGYQIVEATLRDNTKQRGLLTMRNCCSFATRDKLNYERIHIGTS